MHKAILVLSVALVFIPTIISAQADRNKETVEIFSDGKKFDSLKEYKISQVKQTILTMIHSSGDIDKKTLRERIWSSLSEEHKRELSQEIIASLVDEMLSKETTWIQKETDLEQYTQMEAMLKTYLHEHDDVPYIKLDPDKIKTVVIQSTQREEEDTSDQ